MDLLTVADKQTAVPEFLSGGGEMGQRIREYDWASTPLGHIETWPQSLRTCIRIMLTSRQPIWIGWGKELIKFYNDPYKAIVGGKHPWALGKPASVVWKDIWKDIEPMLKQVMEMDEGTYVESQLLIMERNGYPEETYYTFSYTPIPGDDGKTEGMFCANTDDTDKIISERQLRTLTQLGKNLADCKSNKEIIESIITTVKENPFDFPFAIFRTIIDNKAVFFHSTPLADSAPFVFEQIDLESDGEIATTIKRAFNTRKPQIFNGLIEKVGRLPKGAWEVPPDNVIILPIVQAGSKEPYGLLVVGMNPYLLPDEKYTSFFSLVADQIVTSFSDVYALEEERKRAEALAEIDKAKTTFFSNISHEFRTPLTLLLGPVEDILNDPATNEENKIRIDVAYRNALRMQKLVNTLLDFSRIEAGRMDGKFTEIDICKFTKDLASTFRSAIEKARMQLQFDCKEIKDVVYVDVDMWEKIVLNLISNAFKYSNDGAIIVAISQVDDKIELSVSDTGIGIPNDELSKIFDRFHRIENTQGRSQEGTGIGLAMVKELVRLHHGNINVSSELGKGSTFTVTIPSGKDHLPADKIVKNNAAALSNYSDAFVLEAMKWLPEDENISKEIINDVSVDDTAKSAPAIKKPKILLADDNADMREYVRRLLSNQFDVVTAIDGEDALQKISEFKLELILSDVMMPKLDGFGLLKKIRGNAETKNTPVIFLSARAGEEAKLEGLEAGVDDYLVKPFSAKELLSRVDANVKIARSRIAAENNLRNVIRQSPVAMTILKGRELVIEIANEKALEIWGKEHTQVINQPIAAVLPEIVEQGLVEILEGVYDSGKAFHANEMPVTLARHGKSELLYVNLIFEALLNRDNNVEGVIGVGIDVTEQVAARRGIEQSEKELTELANTLPQLVWMASPAGEVLYYNDRVGEFAGAEKDVDGVWHWDPMLHPDDAKTTYSVWREALKNGGVYQREHRIKMKNGSYRWFLSRSFPQKDAEGNIIKWFGTATDIHASRAQAYILEEEVKKRTKELSELNVSLQESNNELQQFAHVASHDLKEPLRKIKIFTGRLLGDNESSFSEKGKEYLKKVNSAADRMNIMIEGVLSYSMLNAAHQATEQVNLDEVIKNIQSDLELYIAQKSAIINYKDLPVIEGASVLLYQLFYNLINNSLKFSKPGVDPVINISSRLIQKEENKFAEITITDNGIGFEQEFGEKIFETFLRLHAKDQFEGTGLGLSLCKRIAERHGGNIKAVSDGDGGASFIVILPIEQSNRRI